MITIYLHGSLKRDFGSRFCLHASSPADALNGLLTQIDGLREKIRNGTFLVKLNNQIQNESDIHHHFRLPEKNAVIHIIPRVVGAGKAGQIIAGVVLIVVGAIANAYGQAWGTYLIQAGVGLALGGVAQMMARQPNLDSSSESQKASRNTAFSNLNNTVAQGQPVPLAYGLVYCGSRVISQGVESRRIANHDDPILQNPSATDVTLTITKTYHDGRAAISPDGTPYQTDFADDSVRSRNYTATMVVQAGN